MERIIATFNKDGTFRGASLTDFDGLPKALDIEALDKVLPVLNASALARVTELEATIKADKEASDALLEATKADAAAKLAEATAAHSQAMAETQTSHDNALKLLADRTLELEAAQKRVIELTPPPGPTLIQRLNALFDTIPAELQPMFIDPYSRIGFLVVQGHLDLAAIALEQVEVPEGYEAIREGFKQLLTV